MSNDGYNYSRPHTGGMWRMRRAGTYDGGTVIIFMPPRQYSTLSSSELFELPEDGYEYKIVETGSEGGSP